jgi:hypothetical protein
VAVVPHSTGAQTQELTITANDTLGYRHIAFLQAIINRQMDGRKACYLSYEVGRNILWLMTDSGVGSTAYGPLGADDLIENGQCAVNLRDSWVRFGQTDLSIHLLLSRNAGMAAPSNVFATAITSKGQSDWKQYATCDWTAAAGSTRSWDFSQTPPSLSVQVNKLGEPDRYTIGVDIKDLNGSEDVTAAELIINSLQTGREGCYVHYERATNTVMLIDDAGAGLAGIAGAGSHGHISNSYCTVSEPATTLVGRRDITLSFNVALTDKMKAKRTVFASATSRSGLRRSWQPVWVFP